MGTRDDEYDYLFKGKTFFCVVGAPVMLGDRLRRPNENLSSYANIATSNLCALIAFRCTFLEMAANLLTFNRTRQLIYATEIKLPLIATLLVIVNDRASS